MKVSQQGPGGTLGVVVCHTAYRHEGRIHMHVASGRIADALAPYYDRVYLCAPVLDGPPPGASDPRLEASNIELIPEPFFTTSLGAIKHLVGIVWAYARVCRKSEVLFVRGLCPYIGFLYLLAYLFGCRVCHWIVGDSIALLRTHNRAGHVVNLLSLLYAWQDRIVSRVGRWLTDGAFVCCGHELAKAYRSPQTVGTVSSTIREDEFFHREDTCQGPTVRILFLSYVRPEKGVEYLLEAVSRLKTKRRWELELVGPCDQFPAYRARLDEIVERTGIGDRVHWRGYVSYGEPVLRYMRETDLLVLPTLSEGTPHVLVEAASNSLPIVTTPVGGIPTMIAQGENGLLVPPKDPEALARAIDRVIDDGELRRRLIRNGLESARKVTVDRFASLVLRCLASHRPRLREQAGLAGTAAGRLSGCNDGPGVQGSVGGHRPGRGRSLGWVTYLPFRHYNGAVWVGGVSGRVLDLMASSYDRVYLCAPMADGLPSNSTDMQLRAPNIEVIPQPAYRSSFGALIKIAGISQAYGKVCKKADVLFVRGLCPYIGVFYAMAAMYRRCVCHWIVANPIALLQAHPRSGWLMDNLAMLYACQDRLMTRFGRRLTDGAFLCNGRELGREYCSPRTVVTVSSSVSEEEFFAREDTCLRDPVRIIVVAHVRPEKGIEYLLEAVSRLTTRRPWKLIIVGPRTGFPEYQVMLDRLVRTKGIRDRIEWVGHVSYGGSMLRQLREADLLVLPTLSEGTPRVLVEARANSLPIIASDVGGIPSSVTDRVDGLLVPPKDVTALALAIDLIISDADLRRRLIRNGFRTARNYTVEDFARLACGMLDSISGVPAAHT